MKQKEIACRFFLPYIVQPEGSFDFKFGEEIYRINIEHHVSPTLMGIVTGIKYDPENPVGIKGPTEIFKGISEIDIRVPIPPHVKETETNDTELRNRIVEVLNEFQYRYLHVTEKYWWNAVSADHFVNMTIESDTMQGFSSSWSGSGRKIPEFRTDDNLVSDFSESTKEGKDVPIPFVFLIDAKRHYLNGEYHLMYVEIVIAFENLANRALQKISSAYEKDMFKEGKIKGRICHLLHNHCKWSEEDIKIVSETCKRRNEVVHTNRRGFSATEAYAHLTTSEKAIKAITDWTQGKIVSR